MVISQFVCEGCGKIVACMPMCYDCISELQKEQEKLMSKVHSWVIYKKPRDYPDSYVARRFEGISPTNEVIVVKRIEVIRDELEARGFTKLASRMDGEDPSIVESWI